jgi:hypothetical protein
VKVVQLLSTLLVASDRKREIVDLWDEKAQGHKCVTARVVRCRNQTDHLSVFSTSSELALFTDKFSLRVKTWLLTAVIPAPAASAEILRLTLTK